MGYTGNMQIIRQICADPDRRAGLAGVQSGHEAGISMYSYHSLMFYSYSFLVL